MSKDLHVSKPCVDMRCMNNACRRFQEYLGWKVGGFTGRRANKPMEGPDDHVCRCWGTISKIMHSKVVFALPVGTPLLPRAVSLAWIWISRPSFGNTSGFQVGLVGGKAEIISYICSSIQLFLWLPFCLVFCNAFLPCPNPPTAHTRSQTHRHALPHKRKHITPLRWEKSCFYHITALH